MEETDRPRHLRLREKDSTQERRARGGSKGSIQGVNNQTLLIRALEAPNVLPKSGKKSYAQGNKEIVPMWKRQRRSETELLSRGGNDASKRGKEL